MTIFKSFAVAVAVLAAAPSLAAVAPGATAQFTFNLGGTTSTSGPLGNIRTFSATTQGTPIGVIATGWTSRLNSAGNYVVEKAYLGSYGQGLGVTNSTEGTGGDNFHQIDNAAAVDFVLLQFNQQVTITGFNRTAFGLPGLGTDNDAFALGFNNAGSNTTALDLTGFTFSSSSLPATIAGTGSGTPTATVTGMGPANSWAIGAAFNGNGPDGFKLNTVTANFTAPGVPEPSTWAMLILGFGMVGGAIRRRKPVAAVAA